MVKFQSIQSIIVAVKTSNSANIFLWMGIAIFLTQSIVIISINQGHPDEINSSDSSFRIKRVLNQGSGQEILLYKINPNILIHI